MGRIRKLCVFGISFIIIFCSSLIIYEREDSDIVAACGILSIVLILWLLTLVFLPRYRLFIIEDSFHGRTIIGSNSIRKLVIKNIKTRDIKFCYCKINKISEEDVYIELTIGVGIGTNIPIFISETRMKVKEVVEDTIGIKVSQVDIRVWYSNKGKKIC